jgi:signal transduction histidine kinase/ActR/RegA family two-component response regulator
MSSTKSVIDSAASNSTATGLEQRVLVLAPFGRDAQATSEVLLAVGLAVESCADVDGLCAEIPRGAAAVVVAEEALSDDGRRRISAVLAQEPAWSNLPVLVMTSCFRSKGGGWQAVGGIEGTKHLVVLDRPLHVATLASAVRTAVESRRRQYQMRDELAARRRVEGELRRTGEQLKWVLDKTGVGVWLNELPLRNLSWDEQTKRLFFVGPDEEPTIQMFWDRLHPDDREPTRLEIEKAIRDGTAYAIDHRAVNPATGEVRWIRSIGQAAYEPDGTPRRFDGINYDITNNKQLDDALRILNATLETQVADRTAVAERRARDLQRLAAELTEAEHRERQRLAKLLHDDLQQLLLAAKLRLPVLVEGPQQDIERHVGKIDQLLTESLRTSRNLTYELSPPVLQIGTFTDVMRWLGEWFADKHGLTVTVAAATDLPLVPDHLRVFFFQAVRELLLNVIKHAGGTQAWVGLSFQDGCLTVQVEDSGTGFDPESVAAKMQRANGFGLFNIQQRLEALGGDLEIRKGGPGGGCFRMNVPLAHRGEFESPDTEAEPRATQRRASGKKRSDVRLLVVDDHQVVREGLADLLNRQEGLVVVGQAGDGAQAVAQAEALLPDAIIMDIEMPSTNGIEATRQIKQLYRDIIVIGLTLHQQGPASRAMLEAGADGYISKQASAKEMISEIRRICGRDSKPA